MDESFFLVIVPWNLSLKCHAQPLSFASRDETSVEGQSDSGHRERKRNTKTKYAMARERPVRGTFYIIQTKSDFVSFHIGLNVDLSLLERRSVSEKTVVDIFE